MTTGFSLLDCVRGNQGDIGGYYDCLREAGGEEGAAWDRSLGAWCVMSYDLCSRLLESGEMTRERITFPRSGSTDLAQRAERILNSQLIFADSPTARCRRRHWTALLAAGLGPRRDLLLGRLAREAIAEAPAGRTFDLYQAVLQPFASRVVSHCLGLSEARRRQVYPWICSYVRLFDGKLKDDAEFDAALRAVVSLHDAFSGDRRPHGVPASYPRESWIADFILCLVAGHESTAYLLATVFRQLPGPPPASAAEGEGLHPLIGEAMRFDSPIQLLSRRAGDGARGGELPLRAGDNVYLHLGAANRDPAAFRCADEFRPDRRGPTPLAFGLGEGKCLGRSIATQAAVAFLRSLVRQGEWFSVSDAIPDHGLAGRGLRTLTATRCKPAGEGSAVPG